MPSYGRGWLRSRRRAKYGFGAPKKLSPAVSVDLVQYAPETFDQGGASSCFGHGVSTGVATAFAASGRPLEWTPSPGGIYRLTRCETRARMGLDPRRAPLEDVGSYPVDGFDAVEKFGVCPMAERARDRNTDCWGYRVNSEPTQSELEADDNYRVIGQEIVNWGAHGPENFWLAHSLSKPVGYGFFADSAFERWTPTKGFVGAPENPYDSRGGGHYVCSVGFTRAGLLASDVHKLPVRMWPLDVEVERAIAHHAAALHPETIIGFGMNSWGPDWGLRGFFLYLGAMLQDVQAGDGYAIEARWR